MASSHTGNNGDGDNRTSQVTRGYAEVSTPVLSIDERSSRESSNDISHAVQHQHESLSYQHSHYWGQHQPQHWYNPAEQWGQNVNTWNYSSQSSVGPILSYYSPPPNPGTANMNTQPFQRSMNPHLSFACSICNVSCVNELSYQQHLNGKEHKKRLARLETLGSLSAYSSHIPATNMNSQPTKQSHSSFHCSLCNVTCNRAIAYSQHLNGKAHKKRVAQSGDGVISSGIGDGHEGHGSLGCLLMPPAAAQTPKLLDPREKQQCIASDMENSDESEEEGEIDEAKEDIEELYNEFTEPDSAKVQTTSGPEDEDGEVVRDDVGQIEPNEDSDIEDMFGGADDDNDQKNDSDLDEMFGDDENGEEDPNANNVTAPAITSTTKDQSIDFTSSNHTMKTPPNNHDDDEHDMFGESGDEDENKSGYEEENNNMMRDNTSKQNNTNTDVVQMKMFGSCDDSKPLSKKAAPMTEEPPPSPVVTSARSAEASIPKVPKPNIGSGQKPSLKKNPMTNIRQSSMLSASSTPIQQQADNGSVGVPKRSYYAPVHADKFWSTLRGWDFIKDLNDGMKKNVHAPKKDDQQTTKRKKRRHDQLDAERTLKLPPSLPDSFDSVAQYKALWAPLLIAEARAQILSDVISSQSSSSTAWVNKSSIVMGVAAKVEVSRSAKDLSVDGGNVSTSPMEQTVVLRVRPTEKGASIGCPVCPHDLLLFVREASIIELALRGKANVSTEGNSSILGTAQLSKGRLGFIGQALNHRSRSVDGLLARASQRLWSQFSSLDELFVIRIGSNITGE